MEKSNVTPLVPKGEKKDSETYISSLSPREIVSELDRYVIGQNKAKRAVAIALRNRWRRQALKGEMKDEVLPKNILANDPKYFDRLGEFISNKEAMEAVYYYYKKVHKISDKYNEHRCPVSENLAEIIEASQSEFIRYIDRIRREVPNEIPSFKFDLVNVIQHHRL